MAEGLGGEHNGGEARSGDLVAVPVGDAELGRLVLDSAVDYAIVTLSAEGVVTSWNEGAERILGWTAAEIVGRSSEAFFTPEDNARGRMRQEIREAAETGRATDERYHLRRDGTRFYAQGLMMPLRLEEVRNGARREAEHEARHEARNGTPSPTGFLKIFRDQTLRHEAGLRFKELEGSVATVLRASGKIGLYRFDPVAGIVWADASCAAMFDLDPAALREGEKAEAFFARIHPDDVERASEEERRTSEAGSHLDITFRVVHADGRVRWINALSDVGRRGEGSEAPIDPGTSTASGLPIRSGVMFDVTERRGEERMRTAVLEVGDRLRELDDPDAMARLAAEAMGRTLDLSRAGFGNLDPDGDTIDIRVDWTARGAASIVSVLRYTEFGSFNEPLQRGETVVIADARTDPRVADPAPLEGIHARALVNVPLMEGGRLKAVLFVNDDRPRDWTQPELDFVRGVFDRTYAAIERVRAVEERKLMNRELAHRMKNMLTIAQVVASQSLRHATTLEVGRTQVAARLNALGRAQDMLTDAGSSQSDIRSVILDSMEPHLTAPERLIVDGPWIELDEQQVLGLSLAIHELATNAGKYGALSVPEGHVEVRWTSSADHAFNLTWRELNGPAPESTGATGFGSMILDRVIGSYFGGRSALRLEPDGAVFTIEGRLNTSGG